MTEILAPPRATAPDRDAAVDRYHGTLRVAPPHVTWSRIEPQLERAGITRVTDHTGLDSLGIPVFGAVRPQARYNHYALGKGVTPLLSKISACMEALEVWHAEEVRPEVRSTTAAELARAQHGTVISPEQFRRRQSPTLGPHVRLDWLRATDLAGQAAWVPADAVRLDSIGVHLIPSSTNGLASGNTYDEALLHGLLELCERDAVSAFVRTGLCNRIAASTVADAECSYLLRQYSSAGFEVLLLDITNDLEVPTVNAYVRGPDTNWIFCGAGAHLNRAIATSRALTEAAQLRLLVRLGIRDDVDDRFDREPHRHGPMASPGHLTRIAFESVPADDLRSLSHDIDLVGTRLLKRRGQVPVVVDLTREDTRLPVVKVLAPSIGEDLSFFGPRYALPHLRSLRRDAS